METLVITSDTRAAYNIGIYEIWGDGSAISIFASTGSGYGATVPIDVLLQKVKSGFKTSSVAGPTFFKAQTS